MNVPREQVYNALFAILNLAPAQNQKKLGFNAWAESSIRGRLWASTIPENQPAMYLVMPAEQNDEPKVYKLGRTEQRFVCVIYLRADATPEGDTPTEIIMARLLDCIDTALQTLNPDGSPKMPGEAQTLGGLVANAYVKGTTFLDLPLLDQQCCITIPITVVTGV